MPGNSSGRWRWLFLREVRLSREQSRLAAELSQQAGLAFHNASLDASLRAQVEALARDSTELEASRRRLVVAEDLERDHLVGAIRRDVGRYLAPMAAELDRLADLVTCDAEAADQLLEELEAQADRALDAMRDLSHGLFPALLADRGLAAALESYRQHSDRRVSLEIRRTCEAFGWHLNVRRRATSAAWKRLRPSIPAALDCSFCRTGWRSSPRVGWPGRFPLTFGSGWSIEQRRWAVRCSIDTGPAGQLVLCLSFPLGSDALPRPADKVQEGGVTVS